MEEKQKKAITKLIRVNLDAHEGYRNAAKNTNDSLLNTFFNKCALDRKSYAEHLANEIGAEGTEHLHTEVKSDLHRVWIDMKTAALKFNSKAVLEECERGERYAIDTYNNIIEAQEYPPSLQSSIEFQKNDIVAKYDQIQKLKNDFGENDDRLNRQTPVP